MPSFAGELEKQCSQMLEQLEALGVAVQRLAETYSTMGRQPAAPSVPSTGLPQRMPEESLQRLNQLQQRIRQALQRINHCLHLLEAPPMQSASPRR